MPTSDRPAQTYDADRISDPRLPGHIRARLRHHLEEGHTNVRVIECADEACLFESFRDAQGTVVANRHAVIREESGDQA